jgi:hypothetical protein
MHTDLVSDINQSLEISLPATISSEELREKLVAHINYLINHDFEKLVYYLYRIDVNESKMKKLLDQKQGENAAALIADLIIERQLQKIKSRKETKGNNDIPDDDKW